MKIMIVLTLKNVIEIQNPYRYCSEVLKGTMDMTFGTNVVSMVNIYNDRNDSLCPNNSPYFWQKLSTRYKYFLKKSKILVCEGGFEPTIQVLVYVYNLQSRSFSHNHYIKAC